jgi:arginine N-succinyltransferase
MKVIRPIEASDLDSLVGFARNSGVGVTTLPDNPELLEQRIYTSVRSFRRSQPSERGNYVFALEDTEQGKIIGVSAIEASIGLDTVWYNYRISKVVHACKEIGVHTTNEMLYLTNDLTGVSELCTLFLEEAGRTGNNGRMLSKCRMLFLAQNQALFGSKIIAEMRGFSDDSGISPFWESLGRKFFQMEFSHADYQIGLGNKSMVAELMPKYPIYLFFLSPEARAAIAKTHDNTRPALEMLKKEGFHFNGYIDIFDGGPVIESFVEDIRGVRESRLVNAAKSDTISFDSHERSNLIISNLSLEHFRAIQIAPAQLCDNEQSVKLSSEQLAALRVSEGDPLRVIPMRYQ